MGKTYDFFTKEKYEKVFKKIFKMIEERISLDDIQHIDFVRFWEATPKTFPKCLPYWDCTVITRDMTVYKFNVKPMPKEG